MSTKYDSLYQSVNGDCLISEESTEDAAQTSLMTVANVETHNGNVSFDNLFMYIFILIHGNLIKVT
jgi:hypothetical protein